MKKFLRVSLLLAVVAVLFASCKSHEKCPAYGNILKPNKHIRPTG